MGYYVDCFDIVSFSAIGVHLKFTVSKFVFVSFIKSIKFLLSFAKSFDSQIYSWVDKHDFVRALM